tara:strand:- start:70686 stop:70898 length:213 start_codon:yes stop_codon:yes gene_type:complete
MVKIIFFIAYIFSKDIDKISNSTDFTGLITEIHYTYLSSISFLKDTKKAIYVTNGFPYIMLNLLFAKKSA